jgi:hypothetical protein
MIRSGAAFLVAALAAAFIPEAVADYPPELAERSPAVLAREAFATPYGNALVAEFGRILRASADPDCLYIRNINPDSLDAHARAILVRNGTRMLQIVDRLVDGDRMLAVFAARAGEHAKAEFVPLRGDPDVRYYIALNDRAKLARVADHITETVDRHLMLAGVRLAKRISPLASGDEALLKQNPMEKAVEEVGRLIKGSSSPQLRRWLELQDAIAAAFKVSFDQAQMVKLGPRQLTPGAVADLAKACVVAPQKPKAEP